jgi:hypothetical protein
MDSSMQIDNKGKENKWTQSIAVANKTFIERMKEISLRNRNGKNVVAKGGEKR